MKKIFASIFALAMIITASFSFVGCGGRIDGSYKMSSIKVIGLTATKKSFDSFIEGASEREMTYNQLIPLIQAVLNFELKLDKNGNGSLTIKEAGPVFEESDFYEATYEIANEHGILQENGDIVIRNIVYVKKGSKIEIFPADENGEMIEGGFTAPLGEKFLQNESITGTFKNGVLRLTIQVVVAEREGEAATLNFATRPILIMKKK